MARITSREYNGDVRVEIGPIDSKILENQISNLTDIILHDEDNSLWGIVYMLEEILDEIKKYEV